MPCRAKSEPRTLASLMPGSFRRHQFRPAARTSNTLSTVQPSPAASRGVDRGDHARPAPTAVAFTLVVPLYNERRRFDSGAHALARAIDAAPEGSELLFVDDG